MYIPRAIVLRNHFSLILVYSAKSAMDDISAFKKLLQEIMDKDSISMIPPAEIYFDTPVTDAIELVGSHLVVWLN